MKALRVFGIWLELPLISQSAVVHYVDVNGTNDAPAKASIPSVGP
jgi:hypothetical protein